MLTIIQVLTLFGYASLLVGIYFIWKNSNLRGKMHKTQADFEVIFRIHTMTSYALIVALICLSISTILSSIQ
jgi:hypothetical protein